MKFKEFLSEARPIIDEDDFWSLDLDVDVESEAEFKILLKDISKKYNLFCREISPKGGYSEIKISGHKEDIARYLKTYCASDQEDIDFHLDLLVKADPDRKEFHVAQ
jgi:hypothetical protein